MHQKLYGVEHRFILSSNDHMRHRSSWTLCSLLSLYKIRKASTFWAQNPTSCSMNTRLFGVRPCQISYHSNIGGPIIKSDNIRLAYLPTHPPFMRTEREHWEVQQEELFCLHRTTLHMSEARGCSLNLYRAPISEVTWFSNHSHFAFSIQFEIFYLTL